MLARILLIAAAVVLWANLAHAAAVSYADRSTWETAVGSFQTEDLNSFVTDTSFQSNPVSLLDMEISQLNGPPVNGSNWNMVDVVPFNGSGSLATNGTPYIAMDFDGTGSSSGIFNDTRVRIDFTAPVIAWGADFENLVSTDTPVFDVFDSTGSLLATISVRVFGFHGFILDAGERASYLVLREDDTSNAIVSMDNLSFATAVPEPTSMALFGLGLLGMAGYGYRRRRNAAAA